MEASRFDRRLVITAEHVVLERWIAYRRNLGECGRKTGRSGDGRIVADRGVLRG
jgi:hypothetical protein